MKRAASLIGLGILFSATAVAYNHFVLHTFQADAYGADSSYSAIFIKGDLPTAGEARNFISNKTVKYTTSQPGNPASCDFYAPDGLLYDLWAQRTEDRGAWSVVSRILVRAHGHTHYRIIPVFCRSLSLLSEDGCAYVTSLRDMLPMDGPPVEGDLCGFSKKQQP